MGKTLVAMLIATALVLGQPKRPPSIVQNTSGWCSPAIANVGGNVTVTCIGVDPRALTRLNAELNGKNLEVAEKIREADKWAAGAPPFAPFEGWDSTTPDLLGFWPVVFHTRCPSTAPMVMSRL